MALAWSPKLEAMASSLRCDGEARLDGGGAARTGLRRAQASLLVSSLSSQVKSSQVKSFDRLPYGRLLFMYRLDLTLLSFPTRPQHALAPSRSFV
jgi:hypothetical protein